MNDAGSVLAITTGLALRLAIPIVVTALSVLALRKLDSQWQIEARQTPLKVQKPKCWKTWGCAPADRKACQGFRSPLPCWQAFRRPNGYLEEKCLGCPVLIQAPSPASA